MNYNTASVSEVEDGTTQESLYSEVSKLRLKDAVIYYQGLLAQNNLISSESSASISHEAMLMGEEIFQNTLVILAEKIIISFIRAYVDQLVEEGVIPSTSVEDELKVILQEIDIFIMAANLLWSLWGWKMTFQSGNNFGHKVSAVTNITFTYPQLVRHVSPTGTSRFPRVLHVSPGVSHVSPTDTSRFPNWYVTFPQRYMYYRLGASALACEAKSET
ncbi:hypothetical protein AVEN_68451-1 [Araneus ventricosus]|uniref:Uncharacterized protein n=1 Tax=Araneus ventricosus TaxID=182803 RepID=A0A4Y2LCH1_ARAVE|nr:hypothetical protein AVEN_68451-1 [Araneus ventricosus]